jgi:outer membrane lipoprotein-sorting protein
MEKNAMKYRVLFFAAALLVIVAGIQFASGGLTPKEILQRADEARGNLEGVQWTVEIDSVENNRMQQRKLDVKAKGYDFLSVMNSPPKVKGQKLLMVSHNMWFAKPDLQKPVPISPRQKLVGGASYGDIAATNYAEDYDAMPLRDEMVNGELCHVFDLKATHKEATYARIKYWVSKERFVGVKAEYYAVSGKMFKSATFEYRNQVQVRGKPQPFISKMTITDALIKNNVTTMHFNDPELVNLPASTFARNLL